MSDQSKRTFNEEIELSVFFQGFRNFFVKLLKLLFQSLSFFRKYIIIVLILIIGGGVGGYFLDTNFTRNYKNEIIVIPNYGSTEYLYTTIEMINSKLKNKDLAFFESIKFPNYNSVKEIAIEPIKDVYSMVKLEKTNMDVFKLLVEKGDIAKITTELNTSQHFKFHKITVFKKGTSQGDNGMEVLLNYLNDNAYYNEYGKIVVENTKIKIIKNTEMIAQIDSLLSTFRTHSNLGKEGININHNSQLNDLVLTKEALYYDTKKLQLDLIDNSKTVKEISIIKDIIESKIIGSKVISLPLLLLALFSGFFFARYLFAALKRTAESN